MITLSQKDGVNSIFVVDDVVYNETFMKDLYKSAGKLQEIDEEEAWMYVDQQFLKVSKGGI